MDRIQTVVAGMLATLGFSPSPLSAKVERIRTTTAEEAMAQDWQKVGGDIYAAIEQERNGNKEAHERAGQSA